MNEFAEAMSKRTDAELIKIFNSSPGDYLPDAMEAAQNEFSKRGLSHEQITVAERQILKEQVITENKASQPLNAGLKALCCIFPGIPALFLAGTFKADGYDRKSKEVFRWTAYGFGGYAGFIILMEILNRFIL